MTMNIRGLSLFYSVIKDYLGSTCVCVEGGGGLSIAVMFIGYSQNTMNLLCPILSSKSLVVALFGYLEKVLEITLQACNENLHQL